MLQRYVAISLGSNFEGMQKGIIYLHTVRIRKKRSFDAFS